MKQAYCLFIIMLERLARRLFLLAPTRYLNGGPRRHHVEWDLLRSADRENYLQAAQRLLEELRIPSDVMIRAGSPGDQSSVVVWQLMVDAALAYGEDPDPDAGASDLPVTCRQS
jgi:hypothetical protein